MVDIRWSEEEKQDVVSLVNQGVRYDTVPLATPAELAYTEQERNRNYALQVAAFGSDNDFMNPYAARERAAAELQADEDDMIAYAAQDVLKNGGTTEQVKQVLSQIPTDYETLKGYGLEKLAADNGMAQSLEDNPENQIASINDLGFNPTEVFTRLNTNMEIMRTFKEQAGGKMIQQPMTDKMLQLSERMIPFVEKWMKESTNPLNTEGSWLTVETRRRQQYVMQQAANALSPEEFYTLCLSINQTLVDKGADAIEQMEFWEDMEQVPGIANDIGNLLDLGTGLSSLVKGVFKATKPGSVLSSAANLKNKLKIRNEVKELTEKVVNNTATDAEKIEQIAATTETAMHPTLEGIQGTAADVKDLVENGIANKALQKDFEHVLSPVRMSQEEAKKAIADYIDDFKQQYFTDNKDAKSLKDYVAFNSTISSRGDLDVVIDIGHGSKGIHPFASEAAAESFAKASKFLPGEYAVVPETNGYFVRLHREVPKTGVTLADWAHTGKPFKSKWLFRKIFGRLPIPDEVHQQDVTMLKALTTKKHVLYQAAEDAMSKLSKEEATALNNVIQKGINDTTWYSDAILKDDLGLSDTAVDAYHAFRDNEDLNYLIQNADIRRSLVGMGLRDMQYDNMHFLGKQIPGLAEENLRGITFKDLETGRTYGFGEMSEAELTKLLKDEDKVLVKLNAAKFLDAEEVDDAIPVQYIIGAREKFQSNAIPAVVLNYLPGGRRVYTKGTAFAKQARTYSVGNKTVLLKPNVLFADLDVAAMKAKAGEINKALKIYRDYKDGRIEKLAASAALNESTAGNQYFKVASIEDLETYFKTKNNPHGVMNWQHNVEVVEDGEELSSVRNMIAQGIKYMDDPETRAINMAFDIVETNGQGFWSRGAPLKTVTGDYTPTVDMYGVIDKTINSSAYLDTMKDYNAWYAREFRKNFADVIDVNDLRMLSDEDLLEFGRIDPERLKASVGNKGLRNKINAARSMQEHWKIVARRPTEYDRRIGTYMKSFANWLGDREIAKYLGVSQRGSSSYEAIANLDPQKFATAAGYNINLGLWNIRQAWLQAMGTVQVALLEPVHGVKAATAYIPIRTAMAAKTPEQLAYIAKKGSTILGITEKEFEGLIDYLKRTGATLTQEMHSAYHTTHALQKLSRSSTVFVAGAENFNCVTATVAAYLKRLSQVGSAGMTDDVLRGINHYADDLYFNMTKASNTALQTSGWTRIFAQFSAYMIRGFEALFNKSFTPTQRARLFLGNLGIYGLEGTLGAGVYNIYKGINAVEDTTGIELSEFNKQGIAEGYLTAMLQGAGIPFSLSEAGIQIGGGFLGNCIDLLSGEDVNLAEMAPAVSALRTLGSTPSWAPAALQEMWMAAVNLVSPTYTKEDFVSAANRIVMNNAPSGLKNGAKALIAYNTGLLINTRGTVLKRNVPASEALWTALGLKSDAQESVDFIYGYMADKNKVISDARDSLSKLWRAWKISSSEEDLQNFVSTRDTLLGDPRQNPYYTDILKAVSNIVRDNVFTTQQEEQLKNIKNIFERQKLQEEPVIKRNL